MNNILFVGEHPRIYDVHWHSHDHWELVYCTSGQGAFRFESGAVMNYRAGEAVAIPPHELHSNSSQEGFTNIHLTIQDPTFPFRGSFLVSDDAERHLEIAFSQAKYYFSSDIRKRELVLAALGELISSYMIVYHSNREFSEPVDQIRTSIIRITRIRLMRWMRRSVECPLIMTISESYSKRKWGLLRWNT